MLRHSDLALSELRIVLKGYWVELNSRYFKYEPIKEQYKRLLHMAKQVEKQNPAPSSSVGSSAVTQSNAQQ
jgi:hypothetical protein